MSKDGNGLQAAFAERLSLALRTRVKGPHREQKIGRALAEIGVEVDGRTIRNWFREQAPQWPAGKHLIALLRAYGLSLMADVFIEDPHAALLRAQFEAGEVEAQIDELLARLQRLRDRQWDDGRSDA